MTRNLRADAVRNREALIAAATAEFAARGAEASVAEIARRAGIGKGTVFRHFPTKDHLLAAVLMDRMESLHAEGERLLGAPDAGEALLEFMMFAGEQKQRLDLSLLVTASPEVLAVPEVAGAQARMFAIFDALTDRARAAGAVRDDVTGTDVGLLMCAPGHLAAPFAEERPELWRRYMALIFDGLRPAGAHPLPPG
ncbi:TetR family transcriptional regulator [Actinorhabdospora filicis]|uniref:TetR family transcriptional regulator n=1 Tax=Actinorhabdospora filicis TaxID=1785913 RepID=A0A9W6W8U9_9ACTN|nr:TetR/AcrR family transcriptional regulator [Actinorhabdospora filicis]GLZ76851.1 TetR family transcriptional regulator [Actinorhabdospora filicis]